MDKPACLPKFKFLTEFIAKGTGKSQRNGETFEQFLGRLHDQGVKVHVRAKRKLAPEGLEPTDLHQDLLRLYPKAGPIRLVTTNFDLLFEQAADILFAAPPEVFRAPALPLGNEFEGIVHVHGSVSDCQQMVLTDKDFGQAYLTEGWARRFLVDLFNNFVILFVGYKHEDTAMNYLARALPGQSEDRRFILTGSKAEKTPEQWSSYGLKPIVYPQVDGNDYRELHAGIHELAERVQTRIVEWKQTIKATAKGSPPSDKKKADLIKYALADKVNAGFFVRTASNPDWIDWLDERGLLNSLFKYGKLKERDRILSRWLADQFVYNHSDQLFLLIGKHNMQLHPRFWDHLAWKIGAGTESPPTPTVLSRWISLLLSSVPSEGETANGEYIFTSNRLGAIGKRCVELEMYQELLLIFDAMIQGRLLIRDGYHLPGDESDENLQFNWGFPSLGKFEELNDLWEEGLKPNLSLIVSPLLDRVIRLLEDLYLTSRAWGGPDLRLESASEGRFAIEAHQQNVRDDAIDVLIDSARDSLEHLAEYQPEVTAQWCDRLARSESPLQRRLAVHVLSKRQDLSPDEKLQWLLTHFGLHEYSPRYEIHSAVRQTYPDANPQCRTTVIAKVRGYRSSDVETSESAEFDAKIHLDWIHSILQSAPTCPLANQAREEILTQFPHLVPLQHPDRISWNQPGYVGLPRHLPAEELLRQPLSDSLNILLSFEDDVWSDTLIRRQCDSLSQAIRRDFHWSMQLAEVLAANGNWDAYFWQALINTWSSMELDMDQHSLVFGWLERTELFSSHSLEIADALYTLVKNDGPSYALNLLPQANRIAEALWTSLDRSLDFAPEPGWYNLSVDSPVWYLVNYWLSSASLWWKHQHPRPSTLSDEYQQVFSEIIKDQSDIGTLAKSIFAASLDFLLAVDKDWTERHLLPLFDPCSEDLQTENFQAVWDGFLAMKQLNPQIAESMSHLIPKAATRINTDLFNQRRDFVTFYTEMLIKYPQCAKNPICNWIPKLLEHDSRFHPSPKSKLKSLCCDDYTTAEYFAYEIGGYLPNRLEDETRELWRRWLKGYWRNRLDGVPVPMTAKEAEFMLDWLVDLKDLFPEGVELAIQMPPPSLEDTRILSFLPDNRVWESHPETVAQLLIYLSKCITLTRYLDSAKEIVDALIGSDISSELKLDLEDIRVQLSD